MFAAICNLIDVTRALLAGKLFYHNGKYLNMFQDNSIADNSLRRSSGIRDTLEMNVITVTLWRLSPDPFFDFLSLLTISILKSIFESLTGKG